jgi:hypothetical protein
VVRESKNYSLWRKEKARIFIFGSKRKPGFLSLEERESKISSLVERECKKFSPWWNRKSQDFSS